MSIYLIRLFLVASFLCGFLDAQAGVKQRSVALCSEDEVHSNLCCDGCKDVFGGNHLTFNDILRPTPSSHRVCSPRSVRLLPTYGGKSGQQTSSWTKNKSSHLSKYTCLLLSRNRIHFRMGVASPRFYYVITLGRFLC